tara:strand:+ start:1923 stop:3923 length:2001 start_codon:yes stop_codon:yes gene_type:complete
MADVPISYFKAVRRSGAFNPNNPPSFDTPPPVINPPGSGNNGFFISLGDVNDADYIGKDGFVPVVTTESGLKLQPLPQVQENGLISGGIVQWTGTGYDFNVSPASARFDYILLNSDSDVLTLATPDVTNDRIDLFVLDITFDANGFPISMAANFITGTPAATPVEPQIDPSYQIRLTSVVVTASSTIPTLTDELIYDENVEWTGSSSGTGTVAFNSSTDPYQGALSVETTNIESFFSVIFDNGSDLDITNYQTFGAFIKLKSSWVNNRINPFIRFLTSADVPICPWKVLTLNKENTSTYQFIGLNIEEIDFVNNTFSKIEFQYRKRDNGSVAVDGYFLDAVKLEAGINPPITGGSFLSLTDTPSTYTGQSGKAVTVKADESGLEFTAAGGGGTFIALSDTPANYTGSANKFPRVNGTPDALIFDTISPYDLDQEGATDGQVLTWVAANSRYEPTTVAGGSSPWTSITDGIYRDGNVAIGRTTILSNGAGFYTFVVTSKATGGAGDSDFFRIEDNANVAYMTCGEGTPTIQFNPTGSTAIGITLGNITSFANQRGLVIRPSAAGYSIITTDVAGTLARFAVSDVAFYFNGNGNFGATVGTNINAWGTGIRGVSAGFAARKALIVQNGSAVEMFAVRSNGYIDMPSLPTASTGIAGVLWNDSGTIKIG